MKKIVFIVLITLIIPVSAGAAIQDIQVSNQTSAAATISWITDSDTTGEVHYSENPDLSNPLTAHDEREQSFVGRTHYVTIGNLKKETSYYFEVVSGGEVNNNSGNYYTFKTMKENMMLPCTIYGFVKQQDGTGAENTIIYLWITHDGVDSYLLSKLVPSNGIFTSDIKGARSVETDDLFSSIDPGDLIHLRAVYGVNCTTSGEIEFDSCLQNLGSITLQCSQSSTTISTTTPTTIPAPTTTPTTIPVEPTTTSSTTESSTSTTTIVLSTTTTKIPLPTYEVTITPLSANLLPLETLKFSAQTTSDGEVVEGRYRWYIDTANGGSINEEGLYRAGAIAKDVTVTVVDVDHEDITATASITISPLWPMMYDEMWGDKKHEKLHLLRKFRDGILAESEIGRECIFILYSNSLEILILLFQNSSLIKETQVIIDELQPGIESLLNGDEMLLSDQQRSRFESLLTNFETKASPQLKMVIKKVRKDIREVKVFEQLQVQLVE